ncbi:argininosuccinate synthase [candidate division WOR-1 bacterium RIFOXYA12_FULL_43_27]|uniref:Argininosuccinate synthase n=1 Tax=candidate division WOR-1 bacterium RIFOXYC2_FULL_46_14 TaxID=1802587 RepID=A0A1F4U527_UNCSA|nr:MAG: argininosuccinate synthase [candidate division WOR-1 bacterium RIFOXYA12_FULL_43_27]OGC20703.1 MAG: argininosuccinate synthase [candidate division WOR-1 bacterium RIFOXYB2_FULL_46_45]OGC31560.1 MAG: argininosuccinate synthase [candidate division WOR-1 bacterium RIFOXYA2_FULL_46_56]OGC39967.1 MAG: argininosuccinate synthase [candidate division WOR-1 bacterium RIFOXYC2_FULL_46_14]
MKVVLAYSGGLDTSIMIKWLKDNYDCEVVCYAADVGQEEELDGLKEKALKTGASKIYIEDLKEEFAKDFLFPMLKSGAVYEGDYLLGTSVARPLIAKRQIEIAKKEKADAVAHGATGKGNDQVRFELTFKALAPNLKIIAPWREWELKGREEEIVYAKKNNIPIPVSKKKPYSSDRNLWHISYEGGILEDPWFEPKEEMFLLTSSPEKAPNKPEYIEIGFEKGEPRVVSGKSMKPVELIQYLNKAGGRHGIGRADIVENRLVGMKSRGVYETPGGTILYKAHQALESITLDRDTAHYKELVAKRYAELVYYGQWFTPLKEALDAFIDSTQKYVSGTVRLKLYKGNCTVVGRQSKYSLFDYNLATFERESVYNQKDAEGFINLFGLPIKVNAKNRGGK